MLKLTTLFVMLCFCFINLSQDYHHWSEQFGARASFLGGAAAAGLEIMQLFITIVPQ